MPAKKSSIYSSSYVGVAQGLSRWCIGAYFEIFRNKIDKYQFSPMFTHSGETRRIMTETEAAKLRDLLLRTRWGALATAHDDIPYASWVAFVVEPGFQGFLLHLSRLARHTRFMLENPLASLALCETDDGRRDPQTLARVSLSGKVRDLARGSDDYNEAQARYLSRFPEAEQLFGFGDFHLFRLKLEQAQFVPGLGQAQRLRPVDFAGLGE